jgi:hypothetical protein
VPEPVQYLIPLARRWGIGDGGYRPDAVRAVNGEDRLELVQGGTGGPLVLAGGS